MKMLEKKFKDQDEGEWVSEKVFKDRTGINNRERLRVFRNKYPALWRSEKSIPVERHGKQFTVNRGFTYNYTGWLQLHSNPLDSTNTGNLAS